MYRGLLTFLKPFWAHHCLGVLSPMWALEAGQGGYTCELWLESPLFHSQ